MSLGSYPSATYVPELVKIVGDLQVQLATIETNPKYNLAAQQEERAGQEKLISAQTEAEIDLMVNKVEADANTSRTRAAKHRLLDVTDPAVLIRTNSPGVWSSSHASSAVTPLPGARRRRPRRTRRFAPSWLELHDLPIDGVETAVAARWADLTVSPKDAADAIADASVRAFKYIASGLRQNKSTGSIEFSILRTHLHVHPARNVHRRRRTQA